MPNLARNSFDPEAFIAKIGGGISISEYRKGQIVFAQGDVADAVFYLQKGKVKRTVVSEQGKEAVVGILEAEQFFGEDCLGAQPFWIATATAMDDSVITTISKATMMSALESDTKFSQLFLTHLLSRNNRIEEDLIDQLFNSTERRLARALLLLANFGGEGSPRRIGADINQETLAEMIGTTRSRVSFFMNKFRKQGFISYNGTIEVHSSLLNAVLNEKSDIDRKG